MSDPYGPPFRGAVGYDEVERRIEQFDLGGAPAGAVQAQVLRDAFARLLGGGGPTCSFEPVRVGDVEAWVVGPEEGERPHVLPRVVWFHGGGYVFGSPQTHRRAAAVLAGFLGEAVLLPAYALAPEQRWPAPLRDALAVVEDLQARHDRVALGGDSAGGHLALVAALARARAGRPVTALALCSPNTDRTGRSTTRRANAPRDPMNSHDDDHALARVAFAGHAPDDPDVSPILADLGHLPPTWIEVGGREVLLGDAGLLAEQGRAAGAHVELHLEPEAFHLWQLWAPWLAPGTASLARLARFLGGRLRSRTTR